MLQLVIIFDVFATKKLKLQNITKMKMSINVVLIIQLFSK